MAHEPFVVLPKKENDSRAKKSVIVSVAGIAIFLITIVVNTLVL